MDPWIVVVAVGALLFPSWGRHRYTWQEDKNYYEDIRENRVKWLPHRYVYPIVWPLLYACIAVSVMRLVTRSGADTNSAEYIAVWIFLLLNFVFNKAWDMVFWSIERKTKAGKASRRNERISALVALMIFITAAVVLGLLCTAELRDGLAIGFWVPYTVWSFIALIFNVAIACVRKGPAV
jgi:tryptophan-rich sensory protein